MELKIKHDWNVQIEKAIEIQIELRKKIIIEKLKKTPKLIAGVDVAFKDDKAIGSIVVLDFPELNIVEKITETAKTSFPYIPELLSFREGPIIEKCLEKIKSNPDVFVFDGQGITHPRRMGIAAHIGIILDKPTIGCAKSHLFGKYQNPQNIKGDFSYIYDSEDNIIGAVLRTKENTKPIFISPGHKTDIESSVHLLIKCTRGFKIPEPTRQAHIFAQKMKKLCPQPR